MISSKDHKGKTNCYSLCPCFLGREKAPLTSHCLPLSLQGSESLLKTSSPSPIDILYRHPTSQLSKSRSVSNG